MKKLLFALAMVLALPITALGAQEYVEKNMLLYSEGAFPEETVSVMETDEETALELKAAVLAAMEACDEKLDVSAYKINVNDAISIAQEVLNKNPILFHVSGRIGASYKPSTGYATTLSFTYNYPKEQVREMRAFVEGVAAEFLSLIDHPMSDLEKVMLVHEYITVNHAYGTAEMGANEIRNIYDFFYQGKGVCQAYALAAEYLLAQCGVESDLVTSDAMNHAWNIVKVDSKYYHMDITWDDPLFGGTDDGLGISMHNNFLLSNEGITENGHYGWSNEYTCGDEYDDAYWMDYQTPFSQKDGIWYYSDDTEFGTIDFATGERSKIYNQKMTHSYFPFMNVSVYKNYLVYNTYTEIWARNISTGETVKLLEEKSEDKNIGGSYVRANTLIYCISEDEYRTGEIVKQDLTLLLPEEPKEFKVSNLALKQNTLSWELEIDDEYTEDYFVYVAAFGADNQLLYVKKVSENSAEVPSAQLYKVFVWNEEKAPLCANGEYYNMSK